MLDIDVRNQETFALACEVYSCILERAKGSADRMSIAREYASGLQVPDRNDVLRDLIDIVGEATANRAGWKVILRRCAPQGKGCPSEQQIARVPHGKSSSR